MHEMGREGMTAEGRKACKAVDLGILSNMPKTMFQNILDQTNYDNLMITYNQTSGKPVAFFMRLWAFKFPYNIDTDGFYQCEIKRDAQV